LTNNEESANQHPSYADDGTNAYLSAPTFLNISASLLVPILSEFIMNSLLGTMLVINLPYQEGIRLLEKAILEMERDLSAENQFTKNVRERLLSAIIARQLPLATVKNLAMLTSMNNHALHLRELGLLHNVAKAHGEVIGKLKTIPVSYRNSPSKFKSNVAKLT
jgi:hypothetical protein